MSYLIPNDYRKSIQDLTLSQIITSNPQIQTAAELAAQAECISYLVQKYDTASEFTDTNQYNPAAVYAAANRVYLNANAYSQSPGTYNVGDLTLQNGNVYICNTLISAPEAFNPTHWTLLGAQYAIFYGAFPNPVFSYSSAYNVGDIVYWNGHNYKALNPTLPLDHSALLQFGNYNRVPLQNVAPDDPLMGANYWDDQGAYTIPAGSLLSTSPVYFSAGDNRSQQMVQYMIDIVLYHLHARITPRNVPEIREVRYRSAVDWLKMAAKGTVTANLTALQPPQGGRIRWGSNIKNINGY